MRLKLVYEYDDGLGWFGLGFVNWTHEHVRSRGAVAVTTVAYVVGSAMQSRAAAPAIGHLRFITRPVVRYFRNLSNIDDRVRTISWQTLNLTRTLTLTLTQTLTLILTLLLTLTPTLAIYIHIHIHGHLGLTGCRNSVGRRVAMTHCTHS